MAGKGRASKKESVKRPMSSWHFFYKDECELRKKEHSEKKISDEVRREIGQKWKSISEERKDYYNRKAKASSIEYANSKVGLPPKLAKEKVETRCNPERVHKMVDQLKPFQKVLVNEIGFGSLLHLKCIQLQRGLCGWLVERFNPDTKILELCGNNISISPMDVEYIMGLDAHGIDVPTGGSNEEINELCRQYSLGNGKISLTVLMEQLTDNHLSGNEFKVKFILFVLGALLCPTMELAPKRSFLHALHDVNRIKNMNWAKFVFDFFIDGIRKFKSKQQKSINGCLLFLMVFYLEQTSIGRYDAPLTSRHCPRLEAWGEQDVKNRIQLLSKLGGYQIHNKKVMVAAYDFSASASQIRKEEHCEQPPLSKPCMEEHKENNGYEKQLCKVERALEDIKSVLVQGFAALKENIVANKDCGMAPTHSKCQDKNLEHKEFEERLSAVERDVKTLRSDILTNFATLKKDIMDQIHKGFTEWEKGKGKVSSEWEKEKVMKSIPSPLDPCGKEAIPSPLEFLEIGDNQQLEPIKAITISESKRNCPLDGLLPQKKSKPRKEKIEKKKVREALLSIGASPHPIVQTRSYELRQPSRYVRSPYESHNLNKGKDTRQAINAPLKMMADWSDLPDDILKLIARQLHSIEDYVRFGGVCRSWHRVFLQKDCTSSSMIPWLMLRGEENSEICRFYCPFRDKFYEVHLPMISGKRCWGSIHGWLVTIGTGMDMHLLNPLSQVQIPLPPLQNCPNIKKLVCSPQDFRDFFIYKVILSSNPSSSDCIVMAIYSDYEKLAFTKPGNEAWTPVECSPGPFDDIIYFNGNFFVVNSSRVVLICDSSGSHIKTISTVPVFPLDSLVYVDKYLVEYRAEIYLVIQCLYDVAIIDTPNLKTCGFIVHKLDMCTEKWEVVNKLDDWSIFLGNNYPFAICGSDYLGCRKNCIYFIDDNFGINGTQTSFVMGIYNFEDYKVESYAKGHDSQFVFSPPLWIRPSLW